MSEDKICPILSETEYSKTLGSSSVRKVECQKSNCGFWDWEGEKCGVATLGDITDALWIDKKEA